MDGRVLSLDTVLSATFHFVRKWSPDLKRNQSRDLLRHLVCRLYGASKGNLFQARIRASHADLGASLDISREWVCKLTKRLQASKWIEYHAPKTADGKYEVGVYRLGRMLKRLLCVLLNYRRKPHFSRVNDRSQSFPFLETKKEKFLLFIRQKEKTLPSESALARIPLLQKWMERGKQV